MPIIAKSSYPTPPFFMRNAHFQTVFPAFTRKVNGVNYERERITTSDNDFLDLDWLDKGSRQLVILTHGLEGNTERYYMKGMAKIFAQNNWDVLAWNCRSCSGEMNKKLRLYFHGEIADIGEVVKHALHKKDYEKIVLVGFSMGGNITLKYLGVQGKELPTPVRAGIAFSAPCNINESIATLEYPLNKGYKRYFLKNLKKKIEIKAKQHPGVIDLNNLSKVKVWKDFDHYFSIIINGYDNQKQFYYDASAENFMTEISVPTLLVNALNDPIVPPACSPVQLCEKHPFIHLEMPKYGGHVGFSLFRKPVNWMEYKALEFARSVL